jgi:H+/Cl- antiporter ClcA
LVAGIIIVLLGRSIRLYVERDSRLLRNAALIVSIAWTRWVLVGTANVIIHYYNDTSAVVGLNDSIFSGFLFTIIVGILIGVASVLLIYIINWSTKEFFKKRGEKPEEL